MSDKEYNIYTFVSKINKITPQRKSHISTLKACLKKKKTRFLHLLYTFPHFSLCSCPMSLMAHYKPVLKLYSIQFACCLDFYQFLNKQNIACIPVWKNIFILSNEMFCSTQKDSGNTNTFLVLP